MASVRRAGRLGALLAVMATGCLAAAAAPPPSLPAHTGLERLEGQVREFKLKNGLTFIVVERHEAPVFSYMTVVNSGSADDALGTTGLAHMMEHMAFKGTSVVGTRDWRAEKPALDRVEAAWLALREERRKGAGADTTRLHDLEQRFAAAQEEAQRFVVPNESDRILESAGAENANASTSEDITNYFYSIPSNRLELWAVMEGGRLSHPVFREFYKERDVVYEERRMRVESSPTGRLLDEFLHAAFVAHPYHYGTIGFPSDLHAFSRTQGEAFFRTHYVAKNMAIAVVGDVTLPEVKRVAETWFSEVSDAPPPQPLDTVEPEQTAERRVILEDQAQPMLAIGWHVPAATDPRYPACEALMDVLAGGDYARMNKALVKERKLAVTVEEFIGLPGEKYPSLMGFYIVPAAGADPRRVEAAVYEVLAGIGKKAPITAAELHGYQVRMRAQRIEGAESNSTLAENLVTHQILHGDWHQFFREQERVQRLTVADLMGEMRTRMVPSGRTVAMIVNPPGAAAAAGAGAAK